MPKTGSGPPPSPAPISPSTPTPTPSPSPPPSPAPPPTETSEATDQGAALGPPDASTSAQDAAIDQPVLTYLQSDEGQLLSTAFPDGLSDPFYPAQGGWNTSAPESDASANGGEPKMDSFSGQPVNNNPNAFTGTNDVNPSSGLESLPGASGKLDTSQMQASTGPVVATDATTPHYSFASDVAGATLIDQVPFKGSDYVQDGTYLHYQITQDGVTYDAYTNDHLLPGQALLVPASSQPTPSPTPPPPAPAPAAAPATPAAQPTAQVPAPPPAPPPPAPDQSGSFADSFRQSSFGQGLGGLIAGTGIAYVPGGFLAAPVGQATGVLKQPTKTFQFFEGAGEAATGAAQIFGGLSGEVGGTALDLLGVLGAPESLGTSLAFTAAGVTLNVASWALIAQGAGNVAGGLATSAHALFRTGGEDLPEGTHSIVEHPDQPVGTGASTGAEILAENLENAGEARPSQYHEAHHIVPENDARADTARTILQNAGIDVNDSNNGVWLARTSRGASSPSGITGDAFSSHDSIHTNVYMNELTDRLEWAQATDTVYETMQSIKIEIELGIFPH